MGNTASRDGSDGSGLTTEDLIRMAASNQRPPLKFHTVHGENVLISREGKMAKRVESFCKGLAFSNRPVGIDEIVCLKMTEMAKNWSGVLRFGVTNCNPATLASNLPKFACPDLTNKEGSWAKALAERYCIQGSILHLYVRENGDMFYGINGVQKGLFLSGINAHTPFYLLLDIYGNSTAMEFLEESELPPLRGARVGRASSQDRPIPPPRPPRPQTRPQSVVSASDNRINNYAASIAQDFSRIAMNVVSDINNDNRRSQSFAGVQESRFPSPKHFAGVNFGSLSFHNMHGRNITLNSSKTVASRTETEYDCGYVFTARPIEINERIVVQVLNSIPAYTGGLAFGLTVCDPLLVRGEQLPNDSHQLMDRAEYWVVIKDVAAGPTNLDELAFHIDPKGQVHMSKNSRGDAVIMHVDHTQRMWALFDVYGNTQQIRLIGTCKVSSRRQSTPQNARPSTSESPGQSTSSGLSQPLRVNLPPPPPVSPRRAAPIASPKARPTQSPPNPPTHQQAAYSSPACVQSDECTICMTNRVDCVLYKCGHMCLCYSCAKIQWDRKGECPMCRGHIQDVIRTFKS